MKVNDSNLAGIGSTGVGKSQETEAASRTQNRQSAQNPSSGSADSVQLSSLSKEISSLSEESPEHAARLERLAAEVQSGSYQVDATELARNLIDDAVKSK